MLRLPTLKVCPCFGYFLVAFVFVSLLSSCGPSKIVVEPCTKTEDKYICYWPKYDDNNGTYSWWSCNDLSICDENDLCEDCYVLVDYKHELVKGRYEYSSLCSYGSTITLCQIEIVKGTAELTRLKDYRAGIYDAYDAKGAWGITQSNDCPAKGALPVVFDEPYIIDRDLTSCDIGGAFKIAGGGLLLLPENCFDKYYIDTKEGLDQIYSTSGYRNINIKFNIPDFDPSNNYGLYIYDATSSNLIFSTAISWNKNGYLKYINPDTKPDGITEVTGTIEAKIFLNEVTLNNSYEKSYYIEINKFITSIASPGDQVVGPYIFTLTNRYTDQDNKIHASRIMNLWLYDNPGTSFRSSINDYTANGKSFTANFNQVWKNSDIHLKPNYNRLSTTYPPNDVPEKILVPEFLVDKEGKAVLLAEDFTLVWADDEGQFKAARHLWAKRFLYYHYLKSNNLPEPLSVQDLIDGAKLSMAYTNTVACVAINSYRLYEKQDDYTILPKDNFQMVSGKTLSDYIQTQTFVVLGVTLRSEGFPNPISIIDGKNISDYFGGDATNTDATCVSTCMHELGHAWYSSGASSGPGVAGHSAFSKGEYSTYDLMRYAPDGSDQAATIVFLTQQNKQMQFSKSLQQRFANVFSITY